MILLSNIMIPISAGFQDDNAAVAMMLGIARAVLRSGYKPRKHPCVLRHGCGGVGVVNSKYDWSAGAYEQVFTARPDWAGKVIADLNFELPCPRPWQEGCCEVRIKNMRISWRNL